MPSDNYPIIKYLFLPVPAGLTEFSCKAMQGIFCTENAQCNLTRCDFSVSHLIIGPSLKRVHPEA
jgi:hypothetical protein